MFKYIPFILLLTNILLLPCKSYSKGTPPASIIDVGFGIGPNYGLIGLKTVVGYKGSGILLGGSYLGREFVYAAGAQLAIQNFFVNVSYAPYGISIFSWRSSIVNSGLMAIVGYKINIGSQKRFFADFGAGYIIDAGTATGTTGINYRIGNVGQKGSKSKGKDGWYTD